jgi:glycine cleavage system H protein
MLRTQDLGKAARIALQGVGALALTIVLGVMVVIGLVFVARPLGLLIAAAAIPALFISRRFRQRLGISAEVGEPPQHHGVRVPEGLLLHPGHTWVRRLGDRVAVVGVDDLLQRTLGPVERVVFPAAGKEVARGGALFSLLRGGRRIDVRSPIAGRIRRCNDAVARQPGLVNASAHELGWAVEIEVADPPSAATDLRRDPEAGSWFRAEVDRLLAAVMPAGPMPAMPDGGVISERLHDLIDEATWQRIRTDFYGAPGAERPID